MKFALSFLSTLGLLLASPTALLGWTTTAPPTSDVNTLNYALTLENLESALYTSGLAAYQPSDFAAAGYPGSVHSYIRLIGSHENAHVASLKSMVTELGGEPVQPCASYSFPNQSVSSFLSTAKLIEGLSVMAYDGAVKTLVSSNVIAAFATIASVEARHSQYLNTLLSNSTIASDWPAFDIASDPMTILNSTASFLTNGCPSTAFVNTITTRATANAGANAGNSTSNMTNMTNSTESQNQTVSTGGSNDINFFQYVLTLEYLEATMYQTFVGLPGNGSGTMTSMSFSGYPNGTFEYLQLIAAHEAAHVLAIQQTIISLGGTPIVPCNYSFTSINSTASFLATAAALEQIGASAYDGALNTISSPTLQQLAATIGTVEARHSQFLNSIQLGGNLSALPLSGFEVTLSPAFTLLLLNSSGLLGVCSSNTSFPLPVPLSTTNLTTNSTNATSPIPTNSSSVNSTSSGYSTNSSSINSTITNSSSVNSTSSNSTSSNSTSSNSTSSNSTSSNSTSSNSTSSNSTSSNSTSSNSTSSNSTSSNSTATPTPSSSPTSAVSPTGAATTTTSIVPTTTGIPYQTGTGHTLMIQPISITIAIMTALARAIMQ